MIDNIKIFSLLFITKQLEDNMILAARDFTCKLETNYAKITFK